MIEFKQNFLKILELGLISIGNNDYFFRNIKLLCHCLRFIFALYLQYKFYNLFKIINYLNMVKNLNFGYK
jgi:hypothetical protein